MSDLIGVKGELGTIFIRAKSVSAIEAESDDRCSIILEGGKQIVAFEASTVIAGRIRKIEDNDREIKTVQSSYFGDSFDTDETPQRA